MSDYIVLGPWDGARLYEGQNRDLAHDIATREAQGLGADSLGCNVTVIEPDRVIVYRRVPRNEAEARRVGETKVTPSGVTITAY